MSLRVLHVIPSLSKIHGGTTSACNLIVAAARAEGIACDIATTDDDGPKRTAAVQAIDGLHTFRKSSDFYKYAPCLAEWLVRTINNYDLLHIHGLFSHVDVAAGRIARRSGVPYLVTPHGMANAYGMRHKRVLKQISFRFFEKPLLEGASFVHMTSRNEDADFKNLGLDVPTALVPLAAGGLKDDLPCFAHATKFRIAFLGRIDPIKNIESIIDALRIMSATSPQLRLAIAGRASGPCHRDLVAYAKASGVSERVDWLGHVDLQGRDDLLASALCLVLPSHSESFGMAALEAAWAGVPCVLGENVGIVRELVEAGLAISVRPDGEGVAQGISYWLEHDSPSLRAAGVARVRAKFSIERMGRSFASLYEASARPSQNASLGGHSRRVMWSL